MFEIKTGRDMIDMCLASQIGEHTHTLMLTLNMKVGF